MKDCGITLYKSGIWSMSKSLHHWFNVVDSFISTWGYLPWNSSSTERWHVCWWCSIWKYYKRKLEKVQRRSKNDPAKEGLTLNKRHSNIKSLDETQDNCLVQDDELPAHLKESTETSRNEVKILRLSWTKETNKVAISFANYIKKEQQKPINEKTEDCSH